MHIGTTVSKEIKTCTFMFSKILNSGKKYIARYVHTEYTPEILLNNILYFGLHKKDKFLKKKPTSNLIQICFFR
jgi:hypothetical protein